MDFVECEICSAKPGSPVLCNACYTNRKTISLLNENTAQQSAHLTALRRGLVVSWVIIIYLLAVVAFTIGGN